MWIFLGSWDYLKITDAANKVIGVYCSWNRMTDLLTGDFLVITFHSDHIVQKRGFVISFIIVPLGEYDAWFFMYMRAKFQGKSEIKHPCNVSLFPCPFKKWSSKKYRSSHKLKQLLNFMCKNQQDLRYMVCVSWKYLCPPHPLAISHIFVSTFLSKNKNKISQHEEDVAE